VTHPIPCCCDRAPEIVVARPCSTKTTVCNQFPSGMAAEWEFAVAGVTPVSGNICGTCDYWNGTKTITLDETPYGGGARECWIPGSYQDLSIRDFITLACTTVGGVGWLLWYDSTDSEGFGTTWILQSNLAGTFLDRLSIYKLKTATTFLPYSANTFEFVNANLDNCENWPSEITIDPVCE
jgi:hypothetical protein